MVIGFCGSLPQCFLMLIIFVSCLAEIKYFLFHKIGFARTFTCWIHESSANVYRVSTVPVRQGSPGYWPPEVLERRPFNPRTADVWALGVTLHVLLTSRLPFDVDEEQALTMMRRGLDLGASGPSKSVRLSSGVIELLRGLLHYVTEVRSYLQHHSFRGV